MSMETKEALQNFVSNYNEVLETINATRYQGADRFLMVVSELKDTAKQLGFSDLVEVCRQNEAMTEEHVLPGVVKENFDNLINAYNSAIDAAKNMLETEAKEDIIIEENITEEELLRKVNDIFNKKDEPVIIEENTNEEVSVLPSEEEMLDKVDSLFTNKKEEIKEEVSVLPSEEEMLDKVDSLFTNKKEEITEEDSILPNEEELLNKVDSLFSNKKEEIKEEVSVLPSEEEMLDKVDSLFTNSKEEIKEEDSILPDEEELLNKVDSLFLDKKEEIKEEVSVLPSEEELLDKVDSLFLNKQEEIKEVSVLPSNEEMLDKVDQLFKKQELTEKVLEEASSLPSEEDMLSMVDSLFDRDDADVRRTILVADDSEVIRKFAEEALKDKYDLLFATNGVETEQIIAENMDKINALLLDINMPQIDGYKVLEWLEKYNIFEKMPVAIMSGADDKISIDNVYEYPIVDMLNKPFSKETVLNLVDKTVNYKAMTSKVGVK